VWGVTVASARADVTNVTNSNPWVTLDSNPNAIDTYAGIGQMRLDYRVRGSIVGIGYSITGYTEVTNVTANAFAYVSVSNDNILVNISDFNVGIGNFEFNINGFPDILLEPFEWAVRELVEWLVPGLIEPYIQSTLDDLLEDIPYSFDIPLNDITFTFEARPYSADFNAVGGTIWLKGRTLTDTINPAVPAFSGSIRTDNEPPVFTTNDYGFAVLVSDNMVNQILYQAFRSGLLHVDLEEVIPDACDAIFYAIFPDICDTYGDIPLTMKVRPLLPPVFIPYVDKAGTLNVQVQMGDAFIHLYNAEPPEDLLLTLSASAIAPATLTHDSADNTFNISFGTPEVVVDTINNPLSLNETLFEQLAPTLVELFLPLLSSLIGDIALPALDENWILTVNDMTNMGYHDNFIAVTGGIVPAKSGYRMTPTHD
ncbi:MAG TPA: hypothetical protein PK961_07065, partial [bacterium]|nr:hypothetical protein [bacterium]